MANLWIPKGVQPLQVQLSDRTLHLSGARMIHGLSYADVSKVIKVVPSAKIVQVQRPQRKEAPAEQPAQEMESAASQDRSEQASVKRSPKPKRK